MQFVDKVKVNLQAGKGGNGAVSFRHEIYIPKGGPDGGDGGKGGSIIFRADKDTGSLLDLRFTPELKAEDGKNGSGTRSAGRSGKDLIIEVPIGTICKKDGKIVADLTKDGEEAVVAKGGDGGFGNAHFKSSVRQAPIIAEVGEPGEAYEAEIELKLLADVGLVGLPNAGKSTFLSVVSNAKPEIADYPFTTIVPNLGVATIDKKDILIADIPGLIEGAAEGKGLGHDFLRHVDRTSVLLHLIDSYSDDAGKSYEIIRKELDRYSDLKDRPEIVALTKTEGLDGELIEMQKNSILAKNPNVTIFVISSLAHQGLDDLLRALKEKINEKKTSDSKNDNHLFSQQLKEIHGFSEDSTVSEQNVADVARTALRRNSLDSEEKQTEFPVQEKMMDVDDEQKVPVISLKKEDYKNNFRVEKTEEGIFVVTGEKIEKFARRTDMNNYASVNRLRDIMKKLGIRAELTSMGAEPESIISIAGKEFTLVEDW